MTKLPLQHNIKIHAHGGHFGNLRRISIGRMRIDRKPASTPRKPCDHAACPPLRSFRMLTDATGQIGPPVRPVKATGQTGPVQNRRTPAFGLGFVAQPSNPVVLWPNHCKPRGLGAASTPIPLMTWPPRSSRLGVGFVAKPINPACKLQLLAATLHRLHVPDLVLLFLPACGPHLIPSATGSLERSLLVSPLLGGHTGIDLSRLFFTCTNAKQAATCTCNTRPRVSPHHVVNHSSLRSDTQSSDAHRSSISPLMSALTTHH